MARPSELPSYTDLLRCNRGSEQIALVKVAATLFKQAALFVSLNPFGNHLQFQTLSESDDGLGDGRIAHKRAVDLDLIQG